MYMAASALAAVNKQELPKSSEDFCHNFQCCKFLKHLVRMKVPH